MPPTGWNTSRYANPRVDTLVEQARRSLNQTEREKLYGEVQDILAKEMVWIPVYTTKEIIATRAGVKGFTHPPRRVQPGPLEDLARQVVRGSRRGGGC